ncbi:MAG: ammonium transporter [Bryobacteraceae bacterium]|nr:ammonium transporter [Bryobacteraceae bacterium]
MTPPRPWRSLAAILLAGPLAAQTSIESEIAALRQATAAAQSAGDNAWILMSAALVLMMTGPGLALFYCGLVRKKNVLGTMMQSFACMALVTILWAVCGYSLAFAEGSPFLGDLRFALLKGVGGAPNADYAPTIPHQTFMVYQLMFAIITPALITGAFAERVKFGATLLFCGLWLLVVYIPVAHMVWGKGGFLNAFSGGRFPVFDFAGGTVVHISSGISALVAAVYIGRRQGFPVEPMKPHSLVLSFIGACLLWVGWFGFNAGSALAASPLAASAFVATHFASAAGALGWLLAERIRNGKPSALGGISGAVAGLATVTQGAGFVEPFPAILIGLIAGLFCFYMVTVVKARLGYDDSLDAFGVHGVGGIVGTTLTGVFATNAVNNGLKLADGSAAPLGLVDGNAGQILNQWAGGGITIALAVVGTLAALKITEVLVGLRMGSQEETTGMDLSLHGEEGYNLDA